MTSIHKNTQDSVEQWLISTGYQKARPEKFNHFNPDLTLTEPNSLAKCCYEVKPDYASYDDLRRGIIQTVEGLIIGYKSYLVISINHLPEINMFLPCLPKIGVITYQTFIENPDLQFNIEQEPEATQEYRYLIESLIITESNKIVKHKSSSKGTKRIRVSEYEMRRKGKLIHVPGYLRKKRSKKQ